MVIAPNPTQDGVPLENEVQLRGTVVPEKPVDMTWYALGSITKAVRRKGSRKSPSEWKERLRVLREEYPLVVFSKVRQA